MKKIYKNPTTEIVVVETVQMIAESLRFGANVNSAINAEGRRDRNDWDDEDYE